MAEQTPEEIEKIAQRDELAHHIREATARVEQDMKSVPQQTTDAAGEAGLVQAMSKVVGEARTKAMALSWKDAKAVLAGSLSAVPLAGTITSAQGAVEAAKGLNTVNTAIRESGNAAPWLIERTLRKKKLVEALKKIPRDPVRLVAEPIKSAKDVWEKRGAIKDIEKTASHVAKMGELGEINNPLQVEETLENKMTEAQLDYKVAKKALGKDVAIHGGHKFLERFDPFPDVPPVLRKVAGLAEFVLPGANIAPALWQLTHNKIEWVKMYGKFGLEMGKVVGERLNKKFTNLKEPRVSQAAAAFQPAKA